MVYSHGCVLAHNDKEAISNFLDKFNVKSQEIDLNNITIQEIDQ